MTNFEVKLFEIEELKGDLENTSRVVTARAGYEEQKN